MYHIRNSATLYLSQTLGNDSYSGLSPTPDEHGNGPLRTFEHAIKRIRTMRKAGVDRPMTLALTEDYYPTQPLTIPKDVCKLTLTSYSGRHRIIGGFRIDGWERGSYRGVDCLCAKLPAREDGASWAFTDLFVNGRRALTTRYPKEGMLRLVDAEGQLRVGHFHAAHKASTAKWIMVHPEDLQSIDNVEDAIINYYHYWIDEHSPIESYDASNGMLVMKYRSRFSISAMYGEDSHGQTHYYLTNVPNTFGAPGEWYLDRAAQTVYYIPEDASVSPETIEAFAPTLSHLLDLSGEDIRIRNLEWTCTSGDYASKAQPDKDTYEGMERYFPGDVLYGGDVQSVCWAPGAIRLQNAERCEISSCYLHGVGIYGIDVRQGCHHLRIENNQIEDVCAGGIKLMGSHTESDASQSISECSILRNRISHCGKRYAAGCGILIIHASNNEIAENEIHDLEYSGISVGWVWGYSDSLTYGNLIRRNHIYNIGMGNLSDMGGIYLLGKQRGTVVAENRIHDVLCLNYGAWGIYLDEGSSYVTVENNLVYRVGRECFHLHYGSNNTVRNNIFYGMGSSCIRTSKPELHDEIVFENNILITDGAPLFDYHTFPYAISGRRNILWDTSRPEPILFTDRAGKSYSFAEWKSVFGIDQGSLVANPGIEGLSAFDFTISPDSPARALGFEDLPQAVAKGVCEE